MRQCQWGLNMLGHFPLTPFLAGFHQDGNSHAHRQFLDAEWGKLAELGRLIHPHCMDGE